MANNTGRIGVRLNALSHGNMSVPHAKGMVILTGNSSRELATAVARKVGVELGVAEVYKDSSNETHVDIIESVRGKDVFIIQSGHGSTSCNDLLMELLILTYACKTSSARKIIGVLPYLLYSKHCMMRRRGCITAKLIASMLSMSGMHHLVTMDLYHKEIQGFFNFPIDNLRASPFLIQYIQDNIPDYINGVVVARYPAVTRRASSFAERLRLSLAVIHGEVKEHDDGRNSPFNDKLLTPRKNQVVRKSKPPLYIVGDIIDRIAFVIDDVIDEVEGLIAAVQLLKDHGAKEVYVVATHAVLPDNEFEVLQESCIDKVLVTNTVDNPLKRYSKIQTIDISMMLAEAIRRIYNEESMSYLFKNIPLED